MLLIETMTSLPDLEQFGLVVREYRHLNGLTQQDLANKAGVDRSYISRIENSHKSTFNPRIATLSAIAAAIGRTLDINLKE